MTEIKAIDVLKDLFAGSCAGFGICITGHPFDTIKVRMQMSNASLFDTIQLSMKQYGGVKSFYQGLASPLTTVPLVNAVVFGSYEFFKKLTGVKDQNDFSFSQGIFSGMFAGFVNSFVVGPIELFKCILQVQEQQRQFQKKNNLPVQPKMKGPIEVFKFLVEKEGILSIFKGQIITQSREICCYAAQFASYEYGKSQVLQQYGLTEITPFQSFLLGGMAGAMCWVFSYPQDVIKTILQCDIEKKYKPQKMIAGISDGGIRSCIKDIRSREGYMGLWKGFSACMIRACYANSIGFLIYERARQILFKPQSSLQH